MRLTSIGLLICLVGTLQAGEDENQARQVIDRAILEIGGPEKLQSLTAATWKTNGVVDDDISRAEFYGQLPGKFRIDSDRVVDGKTVRISRILNDNTGWVVEGEKVRPMAEAEVTHAKNAFYHKQTAVTLLPLLEKECKLKFLGGDEFNGIPTSRIQVEKKGYPDIVLDFSVESGLLIRSQMTVTNPADGKEKKVEIYFTEFKEFDGIKIATRTKTFHNGKLFIDTEILEFKGAKSLPDEIFEKPKR